MEKLIYIVEDDEGVSELYDAALSGEYEVQIFGSSEPFFEAMNKQIPALAILDVMLPGEDGLSILARLRRDFVYIPVIIVSAKTEEMDFVKGLNKGADDYMAKPFSVLELLARVKAHLRRASAGKIESGNAEQSVGAITFCDNTYTASYNNEPLGLTLKEYRLLKYLIANAGKTVTREEIFLQVWGEEFFGETRTLDNHIAAIREKLKEKGSEGDEIITVRGVGYRFEA